ncbi:uncharacterized protein LOC110459051 isoform X1 [Mizuhopecten yessoensis]|uniref:uncharacterized protein LOC110459051 isoform X1 n=1 Tax=Mizuhopecten yessoensis TaxID=6573 RepID=UPI000B45EF3F|nr:uncharacterized protein LOC110459051 isoform X1 [Mizuhopecten yessoensis]
MRLKKYPESEVLDLTGRRLQKIEVPLNLDPATIICDKNNVTKIENLERCHNLKQLSLSGNRVVRMTGVGKLKNLTVLNLPNNSIVAVEGLKELLQLEWLNLSGNSIKAIENLSTNISLGHLDLSDNNISSLSDITHLRSLRTLLLHGNSLTSLRTVPQHFPKSIVIMSLAENEILDINEVMYLSCLPYLEQLSLTNNPCVLMTASTPGFDGRPFILNWISSLKVLDGYLITEKERLKAEWIYCQGKGRHFKPGHHVEVVEYLASVCPLTNSAELESQEDAKLSKILSKQKLHQQELSQDLSYSSNQSTLNDLSGTGFTDTLTQPDTSTAYNRPVRASSDVSHNSYNRHPVRAWTTAARYGDGDVSRDSHIATQCSDLNIQEVTSDDYDTKSQTSLLDSESIYLPVSEASTSSNRPMTAPVISGHSPATNYLAHRDNRPATMMETRYEAYNNRPIKPVNPEVLKGLLKPKFDYSPPQQSGNEPAIGAKKKTPPTAQAHDYDTSQEVSEIEQILSPPKDSIPVENISQIKEVAEKKSRKGSGSSVSTRTGAPQKTSKLNTSHITQKTTENVGNRSNIPVSKGANVTRTHSDYLPGKYAATVRKISGENLADKRTKAHLPDKSHVSDKSDSTRDVKASVRDSGVYSRPVSDAVLGDYGPEDHKAAIMIQSVWRGFRTRSKDSEVVFIRKEIRARRAEDHIILLRSELDRQKKLYDEEKHLRSLQMEAIRFLWKEVQSLQHWKTEVLTSQSFKGTMDSSRGTEDSSYNYSQEIQNTLQRMDSLNTGHGTVPEVDLVKHRQLEKTCANLQSQVSQLQTALQSVSSVVFQSGLFSGGNETTEENVSLLVTGYEDDDISSCDDESSIEGPRWGSVPNSLSPYPSEEEETYFSSVPQPGFPTPPRNLRLEHKGETSIVISWQPSKILDTYNKEVNQPLLGYRVYVDEKPTSMLANNLLRALIHGLNTQLTYKIYLKAVSSLGESNMSNILMAGVSQGSSLPRKQSLSSDSDDSDEKYSTESSDVARNHVPQRRQRRIKSPRQDKRQAHARGKESSASDQENVKERERPSSRSERPGSSRSNTNSDGIFVQPKLHTHRRNRSRDSPNDGLTIGVRQQESTHPIPKESHQSPPAGSRCKENSLSASKMSETFTIDSQNSLLSAIAATRAALHGGDGGVKEQFVKTHRRTRSKEKVTEMPSTEVSLVDSPGSLPSAPNISVSSSPETKILNVPTQDAGAIPNESTQKGHRRTRSKDLQNPVYEWRKDIDSTTNVKDVKKAWTKESGCEVHGIPVIDGSKRPSSRPGSPAPFDISETKLQVDRKKSVADLLEQRFSNKPVSPLEGGDTANKAALPPRVRRIASNEDVSDGGRRTPSKTASPTYVDRRRSPSNGSESDVSESSAARHLDMDGGNRTNNTGIVSKLLQKLSNMSKTQGEIRDRGPKPKLKSTSEVPTGAEESIVYRRQRQLSGSESEPVASCIPVTEKPAPHHHSDNSSGNQSDDPQGPRRQHKTHRRTSSDHKIKNTSPTTPSKKTSAQSGVKRNASFSGVRLSKQVDPGRSGSEENLAEKSAMSNSAGAVMMESMTRRQERSRSGSPKNQHIPILSVQKLQKQTKPPS